MTDADDSPIGIECSALFLADHVAVESGKLYVQGGFWRQLNFAAYPAVLNFGVGAVLLVPWHDHAMHEFAVYFVDSDGRRLPGEFGGTFSAGTAPDARAGDPTVLPLAATIGSFQFEAPGAYQVVLDVDGRTLSRWAFRAAEPPSGPRKDDPTRIPPIL